MKSTMLSEAYKKPTPTIISYFYREIRTLKSALDWGGVGEKRVGTVACQELPDV
jgi:hypothetical protein